MKKKKYQNLVFQRLELVDKRGYKDFEKCWWRMIRWGSKVEDLRPPEIYCEKRRRRRRVKLRRMSLGNWSFERVMMIGEMKSKIFYNQ